MSELVHLSDIGWPSTEAITRVVREWEPDPKLFIGASLLPLNTQDFNESPSSITWDILAPAHGITHATTLDADPRLVAPRKLSTKTVRPGYWREKKRIGERDLIKTRWVGPQDRERAGSRLIMHEMQELDLRVESLIEYTRWRAMHGELAINDDGVLRTIDYEVPAANKINVSDGDGEYWGETGADPIADIQNALDRFEATDVESVDIYYNRSVAKLLAQDSVVRELVKQSSTVTRVGTSNVGSLLAELIGEVASMNTYNRGYFDAEAGTLQKFIDDGVVILVGRGPSTEPLGEWASTPSLHNGGIDNASGGKFPMADYRGLEDTPPHVDLINGIFGLPVIYHPERIVVMRVQAEA